MVSIGKSRPPPHNTDSLFTQPSPRKLRRHSPITLGSRLNSAIIEDGDRSIFSRGGLSTMDRSPTLFDAPFSNPLVSHPFFTNPFPSLFDGIRPARRQRYDVSRGSSQRSFDRPLFDDLEEPTSLSSNVRVIPIKVEYSESPMKNSSLKNQDSSSSKDKSSIVIDEEPKPKSTPSVPTKKSFSSMSEEEPIIIEEEQRSKRGSRLSKENRYTNISSASHRNLKDLDPSINCNDEDIISCNKSSPIKTALSEDKTKLTPIVVEHLDSAKINQKRDCNNNSSSGESDKICSTSVDIDDIEISCLADISSQSSKTAFNGLPSAYSTECSGNGTNQEGELEVNPPPSYPIYSILKKKLSREERQIDAIRGDGNCFFRALSKHLYGSERYHKSIRSLVVDVIATNKSKFAQFVDAEDVQNHVERMSEEFCWATTCEIYAAATLLQRDIYMLTPDHRNEKYSWLLFKPIFKTRVPNELPDHPCYLTLCNTNGNHYDRIVPDHGNCNCFLPCPDLDGVTDNVDLTS